MLAKFLLADVAFLVTGLALGAYAQTQAYGDFMLVRVAEKDKAGASLCGAYDPDGGAVIGKWEPAADGHCHMREFVRGHLFEAIRGLVE